MKYFAYGSNMSLARLQQRTPGARRLRSCILPGHVLRFHKAGRDGSGKCDAFHTGNPQDRVMGALFELCPEQKPALDRVEGLGRGYAVTVVLLHVGPGNRVEALTEYATAFDPLLKPYTWYKQHVLVGAREIRLPASYVAQIDRIDGLEDPDRLRNARERAIHG